MSRRLEGFELVITGLALALYLYLGARLAYDVMEWLLLGALVLVVWWVPAVIWSSQREPDERTRRRDDRIQWASFICMGFLSFLLLQTVLRDVLFVVIGWPFRNLLGSWFAALQGRAFDPQAIWVMALISALAVAIGMRRALSPPRVRRITVAIDKLPASLEGLQIAQITDLHIGPLIKRRFVMEVVDRINAVRPDLVAITGDLVDGEPTALKDLVSPLARLNPQIKGGVFFVPGNHEYYWDGAGWINKLRELGATVLQNSSVLLNRGNAKIQIGGVVDPAAAQLGKPPMSPDAAAAARGGEGAGLRILLAHQPHIAHAAAQAGFDLQLSGHTHGGQFVPWTWVARRVHGDLLLGLLRIGRMWVYVSPGTGTWGPPVRLGTTPEITCIRLKRGKGG